MKINFEQDDQLDADELVVNIRAAELSPKVLSLMQELEKMNSTSDVLPVEVDGRIILVSTNEIIAIEIFGNELTIHTKNKIYNARGVLRKIRERLNSKDFIQVSKGEVININYLDSLEAAFSGNMTAFMTNKLKVSVSRKYLPDLRKQLGM